MPVDPPIFPKHRLSFVLRFYYVLLIFIGHTIFIDHLDILTFFPFTSNILVSLFLFSGQAGSACLTFSRSCSLLVLRPGWFCVSAAWNSQPFDLDNYTNSNCLCPATSTGGRCQAGFFCPSGSSEPLSCPPGAFCNTSGRRKTNEDSSSHRFCVHRQIPMNG